MGLSSLLFGRPQAPVAAPIDINDLERIGAESISASVANTVRQLAYLPIPAEKPRQLAASKQRRQYRAKSAARRYQLNVRINAEPRAAIRRYAKQHRITLWEAVELAIARLTAPQ